MTPDDLGVLIGALFGGLGGLAAFTWTIFRIARGVSQINRAVNHQDDGAPTLVQRVIGLEEAQAAHNETARKLEQRVQRIEILGTTRHDENTETLAALQRSVAALRKDIRSVTPAGQVAARRRDLREGD